MLVDMQPLLILPPLCLQVPSSMHSGAGDDDDVMRLMAKYNQLQALLDDLIVKVRVHNRASEWGDAVANFAAGSTDGFSVKLECSIIAFQG